MLTHGFTRPLSGKHVTAEEVIDIITNYVLEDTTARYDFTVGTDSQTFASHTKIVEVIAIHRVGRGGIFFFYKDYVPVIKSLREKITEETNRSIENAKGLLDAVEEQLIDHDIDIDNLDIRFQIHCDIGSDGRTKEFISEIVGWVHSYHFDCLIKPESYTASGIADKYSK